MGAVQVWAAAQAMGRPLSPEAAPALKSLVYAARGALFVVPWGAGAQEDGFVLVGAVLGLDMAGAIALSLALRARGALLRTPAVLLWYAAEGRERWLNCRRIPCRHLRSRWLCFRRRHESRLVPHGDSAPAAALLLRCAHTLLTSNQTG